MYGIDPVQFKKELESMDQVKEMQKTSEQDLLIKNRELWTSWIKSYKKVLS